MPPRVSAGVSAGLGRKRGGDGGEAGNSSSGIAPAMRGRILRFPFGSVRSVMRSARLIGSEETVFQMNRIEHLIEELSGLRVVSGG